MRIYDFECQKCDLIFEAFVNVNEMSLRCKKCGRPAKRIISISGSAWRNEDAPWIRSCLEVVDKDSRKSHVVEFRKNPNRTNLKKWLKGEGLRHMHEGEKIPKREEVDLTAVNKEVWQAYRKRNALEVR